jgi:hypothetical protein
VTLCSYHWPLFQFGIAFVLRSAPVAPLHRRRSGGPPTMVVLAANASTSKHVALMFSRRRRHPERSARGSRSGRNPAVDEPAAAIRSQWQALQKRPQRGGLLPDRNGSERGAPAAKDCRSHPATRTSSETRANANAGLGTRDPERPSIRHLRGGRPGRPERRRHGRPGGPAFPLARVRRPGDAGPVRRPASIPREVSWPRTPAPSLSPAAGRRPDRGRAPAHR